MSEVLADLLHDSGRTGAPRPVLFDRGAPIEARHLHAEVGRIAGGLAALGIEPGDRVAIWLPNVPAWLTTLFALARLGAIAVSVNTRFKSHELASILRRSEPRVLVYWPGFNGIDFPGILSACDPAALTSIESLLEYDEAGGALPDEGRAGGHTISRIDFASLPAVSAPDDRASPTAGCVMFSTSGTTREPKLVLHDQATLVRHARNVAAAWRLDSGSAVYLVPPVCGVYGFCTALAALAGAAPLWMRPVWDAAAAVAEIDRGRCTHVTGTDDVYAQLLAERGHEPEPFPNLRFAGFAPFNPVLTDIVASAERRGLRLSGLYGTSEVQALFSLRTDDTAPAGERGLGGGYPVDPEARVRARDSTSGSVLPNDTLGELEILAPHSRMVGYFGDAAATRAAFTDDGWYRTGDLGWTTEDGSFVFQSRAGDSLRLGGFLVHPAEIESVVQEAVGVKACQVVAIPRAEGLRPIAFVIPAEGCEVDEDQLTRHVRARLAAYKVPARFFPIEAFPVTASANGFKIRRDALRQLALELVDGD